VDLDNPSGDRMVVFKNKAQFDRWASMNSIAWIVQDVTATEKIDYQDLEDGVTYIMRSTGIRATLEHLDGAARHLTHRRESEATKALAQYFEDRGASSIETRPELRVVRDASGNHIAEVDGVLLVDGKAVVLSHKNYVADASEVRQLTDTIKRKLHQSPDLAGRPIVPAFMAESIKQGREQQVKDACRRAGALFVYRNGRALSVECRAGQGTGSRHAPSRLQLLMPMSGRQRCVASPSNSMQRRVVMF
jgi:hypothetical protein